MTTRLFFSASARRVAALALGVAGLTCCALNPNAKFDVEPMRHPPTTLTIDGVKAFIAVPDVPPAAGHKAPWIWLTPSTFFSLPDVASREGQTYMNGFLKGGAYVVGIEASSGSESMVKVFEDFYQHVVTNYPVTPRARFFASSRGGLDAYGFAWRHPDQVDRIGGVFPVTDWRDWPNGCFDNDRQAFKPDCKIGMGKKNVDVPMGYTDDELAHLDELNPINNLKPLAAAGVRLFHLHGAIDDTVHLTPNSLELVRRYRELGGHAEVSVMPGVGHFAYGFYRKAMVDFLLADPRQ